MLSMANYNIIKTVKSLLKEKSHFLVEGVNFVAEIPFHYEVFVLLVDETKKENLFSSKKYEEYKKKFNVVFVSNTNFNKISQTVNSQGVLAICKRLDIHNRSFDKKETKGDFFLILDDVKDPGNMGTIIRTAESAGVNAIFVSKNCVDVYNSKVLRSTMGAIFNIQIFTVDILEIIRKLKEENFKIVSTNVKCEKMYYEEELNGKIALIIGNEAFGISEEVLKSSNCEVKIPMIGTSESLNASVACAILLYDIVRQKNQKNILKK